MDDLKQGYRDAEQNTRELGREADGGTDPKDHIGNIGDEAGRNLGNLGDDVSNEGDRTFPDTQPSDKQY
ncbi:hypothetical protein BH20CHL6_BH20CHL6_09110 [soil metagenome]